MERARAIGVKKVLLGMAAAVLRDVMVSERAVEAKERGRARVWRIFMI